MYAKNSNKIDLWTTGIVSLKMQEIIHHENFLQIHASALHSVEPYWSEYDTLGRFGGGPLILAILSWIALPRWCCWSVVYTYSTLVYMRPLLHIAPWWFFHGLWSLMMLLHSVQSNVHSLGNTLLFVPQLQKKYCTLNGCCSVLQTVVGHRQDSPKLHTAWSTLIQNCTQ